MTYDCYRQRGRPYYHLCGPVGEDWLPKQFASFERYAQSLQTEHDHMHKSGIPDWKGQGYATGKTVWRVGSDGLDRMGRYAKWEVVGCSPRGGTLNLGYGMCVR